MKKRMILILLTSLILTGCVNSDTVVNNNQEDAVPVVSAAVTSETIHDTYLGIGKIEAGTVLDIMTGGPGDVKAVYVAVGDVVEKGSPLFDLDKGTFQSNLNTTESQLRTRRDNLNLQLSDAQTNYESKKQLYDAGALSKAEMDTLESQLSNLKVQLADASTAYSNQVSTLKEALSERSITSPIRGKVASVTIQKSDSVQNKVAVQIIDDGIMKVTSLVPGELLGVLGISGNVYVYPDGDRTVALKAEIIELSQTADAQTGLYKVTAVLEDLNEHVRNGAYAELDFLTYERIALLIPKKAIVKSGERELVFLIKGDRAQEVEVQVGMSTRDHIEILSGLQLEDQVILEGQSYVKDGGLIQVKKE